jgi:hypothetical protein
MLKAEERRLHGRLCDLIDNGNFGEVIQIYQPCKNHDCIVDNRLASVIEAARADRFISSSSMLCSGPSVEIFLVLFAPAHQAQILCQ